MDLPDRLQRAFQHLDGALDALDAAVERRARADADRGDARTEQAALRDACSRLSDERDAALARARALDRAAADVSARLARAGDALREIMADVAGSADLPRTPA